MKRCRRCPARKPSTAGSVRVFEAAAKDPATKEALVESFVAAEKELVDPLIQWKLQRPPAGNGWNSGVNNAQWGTDYLNRTAIAKSNMYENTPDGDEVHLHGQRQRGQTNGRPEPLHRHLRQGADAAGQGFLVVTLYNEKHLFHPNPLKRYSLGTKNKTLKSNPDGSFTLYAAPSRPARTRRATGSHTRRNVLALHRAYGPEQAIIDGTWKPTKVEKVK